MEEKYYEYYNSVSKTYEFELKKEYNRNGKILNSGVKIPTTPEGIEWFLDNGYGEPQKKKVKKETKTKKAQEEQK
jgi:hypothetical protein